MGKLKILRFIRDMAEESRDARIKGKFRHLVGLVYKEFKHEHYPHGHLVKPFKIPIDWPVIAVIDPHPKKKQAIGFYTINKQDYFYVIDEVWSYVNSDEQIADEIIRRQKAYGWNLRDVYIDPAAIGDTYMMEQKGITIEDRFSKIEKRLNAYNIMLYPAPRSENAKNSGVMSIKEGLMGANNMPSLFFFDTCERHTHEIRRLTWDADKEDKLVKIDDDMMENLYRGRLVLPHWIDTRPRSGNSSGADYSPYDYLKG